jgi:hypothetical protein
MNQTIRSPKNGFISICWLVVILFLVGACGGETKTIETRRGRLKFVQTLQYGNVGSHGAKGWSAIDRQFYLNDQKWWLQEDFDGCDASPNESVEAYTCFKFKDLRESAFIVRVKDDKLDWLKIYEEDSRNSGGKNLGEWVSEEDGKWLIFKDFFYNVETEEKREIKGLPDYPANYFRTVSPDLETVVYEGSCYYGFPGAATELEQKREKYCQELDKLSEQKLVSLWLTDVKTGEARSIQLSSEKYDWLIWDQTKFEARKDWLKFVQKQFIWEMDKEGKFQIVFPVKAKANELKK